MNGEVLLLSTALLLTAVCQSYAADCTERPYPGVAWQRCSFDRRALADHNLRQSKLSDARFERADLSGARWTDGGRIGAEGWPGQCD